MTPLSCLSCHAELVTYSVRTVVKVARLVKFRPHVVTVLSPDRGLNNGAVHSDSGHLIIAQVSIMHKQQLFRATSTVLAAARWTCIP